MKSERKVLVITQHHPILIDSLTKMGYVVDVKLGIGRQDALNCIQEYEGVITSNKLAIDSRLITIAKRLKFIGRMGSGMEIIDTAAAAERGILCISSPEGNANAVAEQALGMLIALKHNILKAHLEMKEERWQREGNRGFEIEGKHVGIIGYGCNGSAFGSKLMMLGANVWAYDKYRKNILPQNGLTVCNSLEEIFLNTEVVSFHVPLNEETEYYFDNNFVEKMQHPFTLLNLSRGKIVSIQSLYAGLISGKINAAAIDVWEAEPVSKLHKEMKIMYRKMLNMPNFIATPHIGGYTHEAIFKMSKYLAEKIIQIHYTHPNFLRKVHTDGL